MGVRARIAEALQRARDSRDPVRLSLLRLINTTIEDKEEGNGDASAGKNVTDDEIVAVLATMIRQRENSAEDYEEAGRWSSAELERDEIAVILDLLPRQLDESELNSAVEDAIRETGATSIRDKLRVIRMINSKFPGQIDLGRVNHLVSRRICKPSH